MNALPNLVLCSRTRTSTLYNITLPIRTRCLTPSPSLSPSLSQTRSLSSISTTTTTTTNKPPPPPQKPTQQPTLHLATVTRTGTMTKTVQLTTQTQTFDTFLQKHYTRPRRLLAHDPNPSGFLRHGDVVEYSHWTGPELDGQEAKRREIEARLVEKGVIRLRTRRGKERKLSQVGVKRKGPRFVVRRVVGPFGVGLEGRL